MSSYWYWLGKGLEGLVDMCVTAHLDKDLPRITADEKERVLRHIKRLQIAIGE